MLDVHPPEHAAHTWRDFFIHIATIIVGLLIAIGLEQSVEALHRHHERAELRSALDAESRQILRDTTNVEAGETVHIAWFKQNEQLLSETVRAHHPLTMFPPRPKITSWDVPDDPVYDAAKASGKLALLTDEEVIAYGELDGLIKQISDAYNEFSKAQHDIDSSARDLAFAQPPGDPFYAHATPEQLHQFHATLVGIEMADSRFRYWSRQARGATTAMIAGERDLHAIERAERQFDKQP